MQRLTSILERTKVQPRPYQARIVTKAVDMFTGRYVNGAEQVEPAVNSVMIESPTGSGKTIMGLTVAKVLQSQHPDMVVGWVAMRRNLLSQVQRENLGKGLNVNSFYPTSMFDKDPSELRQARRDGRKVLLVVDEAQHDAAASCAHLHNDIEPDYVLGLTATPFRTDRMKLCFSKVIKDAGIHQLIQDGYLSKYDHFTIPKWDAQTVADFYCREPERWGKSIFYFLTIGECHQLNTIFHSRGIVSDVVTGDSDPKYREDQLAAFHAGDIPALINCMVLTEGFDEPSLQTVWVRDSGKGPTIQMSGRVFRQYPGIARKQVVQSRNTKWPMIRTAMPDQQYLWQEDMWRTLKVNEKIQTINANALVAIAQTEVEMPKFILDRQKMRGRRNRGLHRLRF